ncbi:MAG: fatty acid desaturase [Cyanobacteria bacterium J06555_13]
MRAANPQSQSRQSLRSQPTWLRNGILLGNAFHYRKKNHWLHNGLNLSVLAMIVAGVGTLAVIGRMLPPIVFIPLGALVSGYGYFALFILTVHEASHNMFLLLKNRRRSHQWNRLIGWLVCIPLGIDYVQHWEIGHRTHHLNPCTVIDPQNCPSTLYTGPALFKFVGKTLAVPGFIQFSAKGYHCPATTVYPFNSKLLLAQVSVWSIFLALSIASGYWMLPVAAFLGLQVLAAMNLFKIAMEHGGEISQQENAYVRSTTSLFPLRAVLMPLNISLHFEHHLNDSVPWYDLMRYHKALKTLVPDQVRSQVYASNRQVWARISSPMPTRDAQMK